MLDVLPIAAPALVVLAAATMLVRRERDAVLPSLDLAEVPTVSVEGVDWSRDRRRPLDPRGGALVEPTGRTLGGRMIETAPVPDRVRVRRRPLVAARRLPGDEVLGAGVVADQR